MRKIYTIFSVCLFSLLAYNSSGQDCEYNQSSLLFNLNECQAIFGFPSQTEYDEFTAIPDTFPGGTILSVVGDHLYRENGALNMHSCTESYDTTSAMCVGSLESCDYIADSDKAVRFDIKVELGSDGVGRLSGLSFHEAAPEMFSWLNGTIGPNNYPTKYAVRVSIDGATIFEEIDIATTNEWTEEIFDFSDIAAFRVTEMTVFNFELLPYCPVGIDFPVNAWDLENIIVTANAVDNVSGGELTFGDGASEKDICVGDGNADNVNVSLSVTIGTTTKFLITDVAGEIIAYDVTFPFDFESAGDGTCLIWNVSYYESISGTDVGANVADITGCFELSNEITLIRNEVGGGTLTGGPFEFCVGDDVADNIEAGAITLDDNVGANGRWIVTDDQGDILGLPTNYADVDFDNAGVGNCQLWYLSYEDGLTGASMGENVADFVGCYDLSNPIQILRNERPDVSINPTATLCGEDNGSASVNGSNGQSPYTFAWSNGQTGSSVSNLAPGNYSVTLTDAKGCTNTASTTIDDSTSPSPSVSSTDTTCGDNDGSASASSTNGTAPYTYAWSNGMTGTTINGLSDGDYTVTVTDVNGCTGTSSLTVDPSSSPELSISGDDTSCGEDNGTASASTTGGQSPYTYIWTTGSTSTNVSGLGAGNYRVTVTDAAGCTDWAAIEIDDSTPPSASTTATATSCGEDNGSASAIATSGIAPYTYAWSNGSSDQNLTALSASSYTVTVTDSQGCTSTSTASVDDSTVPSVGISVTGTSCGLENGTATAITTSGSAPYTFVWSNGSAGAIQSGLAVGEYIITVTDSEGCTGMAVASIVESHPISANTTGTDTTCEEDNGTASVEGANGTAPYAYEWFNGSTSNMISGLIAGTYTVTVTDAVGCTAEGSTSIEDSSSPTVSANSMESTCGEENGSASASVTGGSAPYTYVWSNGSTDQEITNLTEGSYIVTVTDTDGCTSTAAASVSGSINVNADANATETTCGMNNGMATVDAVNGVEPYTYLWSNAATSQMIMGLEPGDYMVTVTDDNGCTDVASVLVEESEMPSAVAVATSTQCGQNTGTVSASVFGGISPYTYVWSNGSTENMISGLSAGSYTVTVTDALWCTVIKSATVEDSSAPMVSIDSENTMCGEVNGSATTSVSGGLSPYTYAWSNGSIDALLSDLSAGDYSVTVTDAAGCTAVATKTIGDSANVNAEASATETTCGMNNGMATVDAVNGVEPYTYLWSTAATTQMIMGLESGDYMVTVTDDNGCTDVASVLVEESEMPSAVAVATSTECGQNTGTVSASVFGGVSPYTYVWSNGFTENMISGLSAGSYTVTVTDALGCTVVKSATVEDSSTPMVSIDSENTSCGEVNGSVTTSVSDGVSPYTYAWSNGSTDASLSDLSAGDYSVTVTDANGCADEVTTTIGDSANLDADASATETTCGENNGMATVDAVNGVEPYTYLWSTAATTQMIMGLEPGDYMVTVTDAAGCTDIASVLVEGSNNLSVVAGFAPENCGMMDGAVTVSIASSGTAPYAILWSNGSIEETQTGITGGIYSVTVTDAKGCTATGSIEVEGSLNPDGGEIAINGETYIEFCQEGTMDMLHDLTLVDELGTNMIWIITNESGVIQHLLNDSDISSFNFEDQDPVTCLVYHLSYEDIMNLSVDNNISDFTGCYDLSNSITVTKYDIADNSESSLTIDMDMCAANGMTDEPNDYSEFTANINNDEDCASLSVVGGYLYRDNPEVNVHSCTEGINGSVAMCVSSDIECEYTPSSDNTIKLDIEVVPATNGSTRLKELSFFEKAPENFSWIDGNSGPNNYPTKFGIRVLKGVDVVFQQSNINTLQEWNERSFTFSGDDFLVSETTIFTVELLSYCAVGNGFPVTAWDIDDLSLVTECENLLEEGTLTGGPYEICKDGIPDFITDVTLEGAAGEIVKLVLVDESDNAIVANFDDIVEFSTFDIESLQDGTFNLYAISAATGFIGCDVGNTFKADFEGCYKFSNPVMITKLACGTIIGTYPNPTNSIVTLSNMHTMKGVKTVSIFDAMGRLVKSYKVSDDIINDDLDLTEYNAGLYMIQIMADNGQNTTKSVMKVR